MRITLSARSKILQLTNPGSSFRISVSGDLFAGKHVDLIPNAEATGADVTICTQPNIIMDLASVNHLTNQSIDYDPDAEEFIISNRGFK